MSDAYGANWPEPPARPPDVHLHGGDPWWKRRKWWLTGCACLVAGGLVAGLLLWRDSGSAEPDRTPFAAALVDPLEQPAVGYHTSLAGSSFDVRSTYAGESMTTATVAGQRLNTMTVGGKTYVKLPKSLLAGVKGSGEVTGLSGKWITGGDAAAASGTDGAAVKSLTPAALANQLLVALGSKDTTVPSTATPDIDGTPVIRAVTPKGDLYVSKSSPHRLLRFVSRSARASSSGPSGQPSLPSVPGLPSMPDLSSIPDLPSMPSLPSDLGLGTGRPGGARNAGYAAPALQLRDRWRTAVDALATAPVGTLDFSRFSRADIDAFYKEMEDATKELKSAVDADVRFTLDGSADLHCSSAGCEVTAHVTSNVSSSDPKAKVTGGSVRASLKATVEIEGEPAGGCTATRTLPLSGTSDIACDDAAAGTVFAEEMALKKEQAEAESKAEGGAPVPYSVNGTGEAVVNALAQVDVDAMLLLEQMEQQLIDSLLRPQNPGSTSTTPGTGQDDTPTDTAQPSPQPSASSTPDLPEDYGFDDPASCLDKRPAGAYTPDGGTGWILNSTGQKGRAEKGIACLQDVNGPGTAPQGSPVGLDDAKRIAKALGQPAGFVARCHIIGAQLGGSNDPSTGNLSPCWQNPTNVPQMSAFEDKVRAHAQGNAVLYLVIPIYQDKGATASTVPSGYYMEAAASLGAGQIPLWGDATYAYNTKQAGSRSLSLAN